MLHPITDDIRRQLKELVKKFGTQAELAKELGITQSRISKYISSAIGMRDEHYQKILPYIVIGNYNNICCNVDTVQTINAYKLKLISEIMTYKDFNQLDKIKFTQFLSESK